MVIDTMIVREKKHRLHRELYIGQRQVSFTLCLGRRDPIFVRSEVVECFHDILVSSVEQQDCMSPVYCFMPDHQHLIISGSKDNSDIWKVVVSYKQKTGYWMSKNFPQHKWQKDFYDHIIREHESLSRQVKYILNNPVRKGIVSEWSEYRFKGSIGCKLEDVLNGII